MAKKSKKAEKAKTVLKFYCYLFVVWGFYRLLFQFPGTLEELVFKPIVWLTPLYFIIKSQKIKLSELGINSKNFFQVAYSSIILGFVFSIAALLVNYLKYGQLNFGANLGDDVFLVSVFASFVTAIVEEIPFRGYIYSQTQKLMGSDIKANILTSVGWSMIHLPVAVFDWKLDIMSLGIYLALTFVFSVAATSMYARTKNIATPILLHVFWQWPIILFR